MKVELLGFSKILINKVLLFLTIVFLIEIIFGYWFDESNFGPYMREHRMKKTLYQIKTKDKTINYTYKRNYNGFRGNEMNPNEIEIIFVGGSGVDEKYKPEKLTIVGFLNKNLEKENIKIKVINAGIEGQSTIGHIANFKYWFPKLKEFSPKYIIFYVGGRDAKHNISNKNIIETKDGMILNPNAAEVFTDNIKSRSVILDSIKRAKHRYYNGNEKKRLFYDFNTMSKKKPYDEEYLNYDQKIMNYNVDKILENNFEKIGSFLNNIDKLADHTIKLGAIPIFINQSASTSEISKKLFALNISLIDHCQKNNYICVDLAKELTSTWDYWWGDIHSTPLGSKKIANIIFLKLKTYLKNDYLN